MEHRVNLFALLDDDNDGGDVDFHALLARAEEAKITSQPESPKPEIPNASSGRGDRGERRERGERGERGRGRGSSQSRGRFGNGYVRELNGDFDGRGRGGVRGRGRGRGRGFYGDRAFGNENQFNTRDENRKQDNDGLENRPENMEKNRDFGNQNGDWEVRRYGRENQGYWGENRGFRGRDARGYGGGNQGFRRGEGRRFGGGRGGMQNGGRNNSEHKEDGGDAKEEAAKIVANGNEEPARNDPDTAEGPKVAYTQEEKADHDAANGTSDDATEKKVPEEKKIHEEKTKDRDEDDKKMTLDEYQKLLHDKHKALEALKPEERKVVIDKQFDGMQLVEKKKEDEIFFKLKSENKLTNKDSLEKEGKVRKSVSINEFLKPAEGETFHYRGGRSRGRGRGNSERGGYQGGLAGRRDRSAPDLSIQDPCQFPLLGGVSKS